MKASPPAPGPAATWWRAVRRAPAALRAVHDEQVRMWELLWQSGRVPVNRAGPLAWTPSLDGPRLTGCHLPGPGESGPGTGP